MILSYFAVLKSGINFIITDSIKQVLKFLEALSSALVKLAGNPTKVTGVCPNTL